MKRLLPLVLLVCLGVGCGSSKACPHGAEIVLRAVPQGGEPRTSAGMELARNIISSRLDTLGVASPSVTIRGSDEIVVDVAGTHVPEGLTRVISMRGELQFFDFEKDLAPPTVKNGTPTPYPTLYALLTAVRVEASSGTPEAYYVFRDRTARALQGPASTRNVLLAPYGGKQPAGTSILAVPEGREVASASAATPATQPVGNSPNGIYWYLFTLPPEITGTDIHEATVRADSDPSTGQPQVILGFTRHGAKEFQAITKAEYERGQLVAGLHGSAGQVNQLYAQHNAIVLDNKLQATPYIDYTDNALSHGIAVPGAVISNMGSIHEAHHLALVLQSGSLPYRFELVSSTLCAR